MLWTLYRTQPRVGEWKFSHREPPKLFAEGTSSTPKEALEAAIESIFKVMEHTDLDFSTRVHFRVDSYTAYMGSVAGFLKWSSEVKEGMEDG